MTKIKPRQIGANILNLNYIITGMGFPVKALFEISEEV